MTTAIQRIRELVAAVPGVKRAYSDHDDGADGLPGGLFETPAALILAGPTISYEQKGSQWHRHIYEVRILVLTSQGAIAERGHSTGQIVDGILDAMNANVTLGERCEWSKFERQNGYTTFEYGETDRSGYEIIVRVSQKSVITTLERGS